MMHLPPSLRRIPLEAYAWTAGLAALACADPTAEGLLRLCPLDRLGLSFCPGCGLGHSIAFLFRGEWTQALASHPLGPFAVTVLTGRVASLVRDALRREQPAAGCRMPT